jgi:hypothetical protein
MSSNETLSVTAWEKTHPTEVAACDKESTKRQGDGRPSRPSSLLYG